MKFYPDTLTEKELTQLEKNIAEMYGQASKEMGETANRYFNKLTDRYNKELEAFKEGKYTKEEFIAWYQTQVQRGDGYKTMANKLASRATEADIVAQALINDATPSIFSLNANYEAYRITQVYNNIDFQLYDEQTVRRLMAQQNHIEFKTVSVNPIRDYEWNRKEIHKALTAGILQGKSPEHLAQSYLKVMKRDEVSARRNARTSFTSAQNAGRLETYYRADKMGIKLEKEWISTHDDRTRDSHGDLDGERVAFNKEFSNGLMYPADKDGAPAEVYNCRCTTRAIIPEVNDEQRKTYKEWAKEQEKKQGKKADNKTKPVKGSTILGIGEKKAKNTTPVYKYKECKTIEEAKRYAKDELKINLEYFDGLNVEAVNLMLKSTVEAYNVFGNLSDDGYLKGFYLYPKKVSWAGAYSVGFRNVYVKNVKAKNCVSKMIKEAKENKAMGWWSTGEAQTVFRHEIGHAVQHKYLDALSGNPFGNSKVKEDKIEQIRQDILKKCGIIKWKNPDTAENISNAGSYISYYGLRNTGELVAESVAEYLAGNPRDTAKKVVEILLGG